MADPAFWNRLLLTEGEALKEFKTRSSLQVVLTSLWPVVASLLASEIVKFDHKLEYYPLSSTEEVGPLIRERPWDVFAGIWPDHELTAPVSSMLVAEFGPSLQSQSVIRCGPGAVLIAIRRCGARRQAEARRLAGALSHVLRELAAQLLLEQLGPYVAAIVDTRMDAGELAQELNNLLTVLVKSGETLLRQLSADPTAHKHAADVLQAATRIAAVADQLARLAPGIPSTKPSSSEEIQ